MIFLIYFFFDLVYIFNLSIYIKIKKIIEKIFFSKKSKNLFNFILIFQKKKKTFQKKIYIFQKKNKNK